MLAIDKACNARIVDDNPNKIICVCSESHCPEVGKFNWPKESGDIYLVESSRSGKRWDVRDLNDRSSGNSRSYHSGQLNSILDDDTHKIFVNISRERQNIIGWGGAFTDSSGISLYSLPRSLQEKLVEGYFGETGLKYNIGRVPIGGSDFSPRAYSYDDTDKPDYELKHWALAPEDMEYKIPFIKWAAETLNKTGVELKLIASPWSPPRWMKTNNDWIRGALIEDDRIYESYTKYLINFFDSYEKLGIKFWGATVQNEPVISYTPGYYFNSLNIGSQQMIKLITKYLGPALFARGMTKDKFKLIAGDDNLGWVNYQLSIIMRDPEVKKYISGLAYHWYASGRLFPHEMINDLWNMFKDDIEFMMMTEASQMTPIFFRRVDLGNWMRAEAYAIDIIEDLNRYTSAWIDWNLALDFTGGPSWIGNNIDSPIIVDEESKEYFYQPMYFILAHFSKLFLPGSISVETTVEQVKFSLFKDIMATAVFHKQTNHVVINILNKSFKDQSIKLAIVSLSNPVVANLSMRVGAKSITSIVMKL